VGVWSFSGQGAARVKSSEWIPGDQNFHQNFGSRKFGGEQQENSTRLCINPLLRPFTTTEKALLMLMAWAFTTTEAN
jgi:hypothetical protein